jgi:hypothetical protein
MIVFRLETILNIFNIIITLHFYYDTEISLCCTDDAIIATSSMRLPIDQIIENINCKDVGFIKPFYIDKYLLQIIIIYLF